MIKQHAPKPWYKEPWPWILMAGPVVVVLASLITMLIAMNTNDGLVEDDYYLKGLNIHQTIASTQEAQKLGLKASLLFRDTGELSLTLESSDNTYVLPKTILVSLSHPTRAGLDQRAKIQQVAGNQYTGQLVIPRSGHWIVTISHADQWRMTANVVLPMNKVIIRAN